MKLRSLDKFYTHILRRRNRAQRALGISPNDPLNHLRTRLDAEVVTLDRVLDDLDRLIKNHHDKWHDRKYPQ